MPKLKVLAISGSLRRDSYNRKALRIATQIAEDLGAEIAEADLKELALPIYDGDIEAAGFPESVLKLKAMVEAADVLLIATPEYNFSVPAALKNALEWLSRGDEEADGKVAAIFGAATGGMGTVRAQLHLRQVLLDLNVLVLPKPQVHIRLARQAFNPDGSFSDQKTHELLKNLIQKTFDFALQLKK